MSAHYLTHLENISFTGRVLGIGTTPPRRAPLALRFDFKRINLLDARELGSLVRVAQPRICVHLAAMSSVADSWRQPNESFVNNTNIFLNLIEAIKKYSPETRVLSIGSSEQYGVKEKPTLPLTELESMEPVSPYGAARCAQEWLGKAYVAGYGLDVVMTRSFNHIGPYQDPRFVLSRFARTFAEAISKDKKVVKLVAGNLDVVRDFVDVRDVVNAYEAILHGAKSGDVFNVCTGQGTRLIDAIDHLSTVSGLKTDIKIDQSLMRPIESTAVIGSHEHVTTTLGWRPLISLQQSLQDLLAYWVKMLAQ